jgi:tubulin-specific chaperone A
MYHQFVSAKEQQRLRDFERANQAQQEALRNRLDAGLINQRQYDQAQKALEKKMEKRRAESEYKQAKRQKEMAIADITLNTAIGVSKALAQGGFVLGVPWAAVIGALGAIQLGLALAQPLPSATGYEQGYGYGTYPMRREQDGKIYNVTYGGEPKSGMVNRPTHFIAGEMPELIIANRDWKRFNPAVMQSIRGELARVRGYEGGYTGPSTSGPAVPQGTDPVLIAMVAENTKLLRELRQSGVTAFLSRDMDNTKKIKDDLEDLDRLRKKAAI